MLCHVGLATFHPAARVYVAAALTALEDSEGALASLSQACEESPFNEQLLVALAEEYHKRGQVGGGGVREERGKRRKTQDMTDQS